MTELLLEDVTRRFGDRTVFSGVCARVSHGEVLVVTGENGAGKSTLLSVIAGLLPPTAGRVTLRCGEHSVTPEERGRRVALVSPDLTLYPELTAQENLLFFGGVRGCSGGDEEALLERVGLRGRGRDRVETFSSGMRVRLKYAVALQGEPCLLLLDEPTAMLDAGGVAIVDSVIREQRSRGVLVLATNDPDERRHADLLLHLPGSASA